MSQKFVFFDNPSKNAILIAKILNSVTGNSNEGVEIYDADLKLSGNCSKTQCNEKLNHRFFLRFINVEEQMRIRIEAHFDGHDTQNICGREGVTLYSEDETIQPKLGSKNEEFICDDTFKIVIVNKSMALKIGVVLIVIGTIVTMIFCKRTPREALRQKISQVRDFGQLESYRGGETFEATIE
jgi:hypothetical protein